MLLLNASRFLAKNILNPNGKQFFKKDTVKLSTSMYMQKFALDHSEILDRDMWVSDVGNIIIKS